MGLTRCRLKARLAEDASRHPACRAASAMPVTGLDPGSWTRCHFGYAASVRVADLAAA